MAVARRAILLGGLSGAAGALGLAGGGYLAIDRGILPGRARVRDALGLTGTDGTVPAVPGVPTREYKVKSRARGTEVTVLTMTPPGARAVCLALHGRDGDARSWLGLGLPRFLAAATAVGVPPFAVVAIDGGTDSYWHERHPGDDPQRMLTEELPRWLKQQGLAAPSLALGISMGGSGVLQYARARGGELKGVAAISPALFPTWKDASSVGAYASEADWSAHEPLRLATRVAENIGVWCGRDDPFYKAARHVPNADHTAFAPGLHTGGYWLRVLPEALTFLGAAAK
ncbi:alpha/beta hydrolase-fold protein [Actinocorallia lasiicapitis]